MRMTQDRSARVRGYQEVQDIELTCPSKIQRSLEHFQEGDPDQPEPEVLPTTLFTFRRSSAFLCS